LAVLNLVFSLWTSVAILWEELLYFGFTCLDLYYFWIRRAHAGLNVTEEEVEERNVKLVEEPCQEPILAFLTRDIRVRL
jgi:hypothetical protein